MKFGYLFLVTLIVAISCVPAKKYNDLVAREKQCSEELEKYKTNALDFEGKYKDIDAKHTVLLKEVDTLTNSITLALVQETPPKKKKLSYLT